MAADEDIGESSSTYGTATGPANAIAASIANDAAKTDPSMAARVAALIDEQTRVLRLQAKELEKEDAIRHWSLRVRHISDVLRLCFALAAAGVVTAVAAFIGGAVWSASHDNGLVIEEFQVPADFAARGLSGRMVASELQDRLAAIQDETGSARAPSSYTNNWGSDIKVQIPDTGVSIGEFYRILAAWLGNQTHITGEVFRTGKGIAITSRTGGDGGTTIAGPEENFDALVQQTAEAILKRTQPYRYAIYAAGRLHRTAEARAILQHLSVEGATPAERAWAFIGLNAADAHNGDLYAAVADSRRAEAIVPDFPMALGNIDEYGTTLGHDEEAMVASRESARLLESGDNPDITPGAKRIMIVTNRVALALHLGDFGEALRASREVITLPDYSSEVESARESIIQALGNLHEGGAARAAFLAMPPTTDATIVASRAAFEFGAIWSSGDWRAVIEEEPRVERAVAAAGPNAGLDGDSLAIFVNRTIQPSAAYAFAETGDFARAHALIDRTPMDCYLCVYMRADIDAAQKNWAGAEYWFVLAVRQAPSIPFAYLDWGRMLTARGDLDGAIAKFMAANQKGPHFADPLEYWGEALIRQSRSDLALPKFAEAVKYAPNWGRLHLKWGEALLWSGKKDDAQRQFALAASLDLTSREKAELAKMR